MKTKIISKTLLTMGLVFVLGSAITQVRGGTPGSTTPGQPTVTIHSTDNVIRGNTGSFVLNKQPVSLVATGTYANFSASGTAIQGVDYIAIVSPTFIGASGYGTILIKTLPDPRGGPVRQSYSVVVTMASGAGYAVGQPSEATMWIKPGGDSQ